MSNAPKNNRLPDFVIIGAMKSATSTLYQQLVSQPGIFMCTPKEPNFFSDDEQYKKGMQWYARLFDSAEAGSLLGEASTHYTKLPTHPHALERLKEHIPNAKLVYVMRHPVDRLVSHFMHEWSTGIYRCGIDEAVRKYPELIAYGQYAMQLKPYLESFGKDAVLPVFFDHLIREPQAELERVCEFIGYQGKPVWKNELRPDNVSSERIRKFKGYDLLVESRLATWLRRTLIPQSLRDVVKERLRMQKRPTLSEGMRQELEREFDHDLSALGNMLGVEIDCQNFRKLTSVSALEWATQDNGK